MSTFIKRSKCDICSSSHYETILSVSFLDSKVFNFLESYYESRIPKNIFTGIHYEIAKCHKCNFVWQVNILNDDLNSQLYNQWISKEYSLEKKKVADFEFYHRYYTEIEIINRLINGKPFETKILDFGMGWGYWCLMAKAFGFDIYGHDISPDRVKNAEKNNIKLINPLDENVSLNLDFINAEQVFEHIKDPFYTLKSLVEKLKPGGIIRISVPNGNNAENKLSNPDWTASHDELHPLEHINCFSSKCMLNMTRKAGLLPVDIDLYNCSKIKNHNKLINKLKEITGIRYQNIDSFPKYFKKHSQ